jgi:hypothetical protein
MMDTMRINAFAFAGGLMLAACAAQQQARAQSLPPPLIDAPQAASPQAGPRAPAPWQTQPMPDIAPPQTVPSQKSAGRYNFDRVGDSFMRFDTMSGEVSVCGEHSAGWACEAVPEDRAALENEIGRLQSEVTALKAEVASLREPPPPRPPADLTPRAKEGDVTNNIHAQDDIDRARVTVAYAWRRLVDMLVGIRNDVMKRG